MVVGTAFAAAPMAGQDHPGGGWNGPRALKLAAKAIEARRHAYSDSALRQFEASVEGHVYFLGDFLDRRELVRADQVALRVLWQSPDRSLQTIVGRRHEKLLPTDIRYHIDHLSLILDNFGDRIRLGEGEEVRDVPHPAASGAMKRYDYRLADSLEIRVLDRTTRVYRLLVRPSDPGTAGVVGALFVDRDTGAIARMVVTFTGAAYRDPDLEYINLDLRSGLWEGRYWLPVEQEVEIRRQVSWLSFPVGGIIRTRLAVEDYRINEPTAYSLAPGERVLSVPDAALEAYSGWNAPLHAGPVSETERTGLDVSEVHRLARQQVTSGALMGTSRFQLHLPNASSGFRARRAEGVLLGAGGAVRLDERADLDLWLGYPFGRERVEASGRFRYGLGDTELSLEVVGNRLADIGPFPAVSGVVSTMALALEGDDYTDPFFEDGFELRVGGSAFEGRASVGVFYLSQRSAELVIDGTALGGELPRPVREIDDGTVAGVRGGIETRLGSTWELALDVEAAFDGPGDFGFSRFTGTVRAEENSPGSPWGWMAEVTAAAAGGTLPAQRLFLLGGRGTVPGYPFRAWGGDLAALLNVRVSREIVPPLIRLRLIGAAGWSDLGEPGSDAAEHLGVGRTGGVRPSLGLGLGLFYDLARLDMARGLDGGEWELIFSFKRSLWPIL